MQSPANATSLPSSSPVRVATGRRLISGVRLALRAPQVRGENDHGRARVERVLDRRQRCRDARVVADRAALERDVEVDTDEHAPPFRLRSRTVFLATVDAGR